MYFILFINLFYFVFIFRMSTKHSLSPSLRVENNDYYFESINVMVKNIRFLDSLIRIAPTLGMNDTTTWMFEQMREVHMHRDMRKVSLEYVRTESKAKLRACAQSDLDLYSPLTESLKNVEYIDIYM